VGARGPLEEGREERLRPDRSVVRVEQAHARIGRGGSVQRRELTARGGRAGAVSSHPSVATRTRGGKIREVPRITVVSRLDVHRYGRGRGDATVRGRNVPDARDGSGGSKETRSIDLPELASIEKPRGCGGGLPADGESELNRRHRSPRDDIDHGGQRGNCEQALWRPCRAVARREQRPEPAVSGRELRAVSAAVPPRGESALGVTACDRAGKDNERRASQTDTADIRAGGAHALAARISLRRHRRLLC
jgi:hypothetical protein